MAGPVLSVLVVVAVLLTALAVRDDPYVVPPSTGGPAAVDPDGAARALQRLTAALGDGDAAAARALADPGTPGASALLGDLATTAAAARVEDLSMRYLAEDGGVAADGTWAAAVAVTWAYGGFDRGTTSTEVLVRFRSATGGTAVAGVGGGTLRTPVWMSGAVQVSRTADLLVLAARGVDLATYVDRARTAVPTVSRVLEDWPRRLVVEVPADGAGLEAALGAEEGYYAQIAAVTGSGGVVGPDAPVHVFVNPDVFDGLGRIGQEVVLAHEATHVATDAPSSSGPTWLVEGFADYVALRDTPLPLSRTAAQVARQVREDGPPADLPGPADFDTRGPHLGAVYESSWLVCVTLAERGGEDALRRFYGRVDADRAFDWSERNLVEAWQERLRRLPPPQ